MILAPDKRFIFIHVPKAAGTSIHGALSQHDIFFSVAKNDVVTRTRRAGEAGLPPMFLQLGEHASARQLITVMGRETYDGFFSFAFVRNPWDVAVSWFHYRLINPDVAGHAEAEAAGTFPVYVRKVLAKEEGARWVGLQKPFVADADGKLAVSMVGRYESLAADFGAVTQRLGVKALALDHFNQSYHAAWPSLYSRETFAAVGRLVAEDAALFGYSSDPATYGL